MKLKICTIKEFIKTWWPLWIAVLLFGGLSLFQTEHGKICFEATRSIINELFPQETINYMLINCRNFPDAKMDWLKRNFIYTLKTLPDGRRLRCYRNECIDLDRVEREGPPDQFKFKDGNMFECHYGKCEKVDDAYYEKRPIMKARMESLSKLKLTNRGDVIYCSGLKCEVMK